jgi:hypothetical protein
MQATCSISEAAKKGMAVVFNTRFRNSDLSGDPYMGWPIDNRNKVLENLRKLSSGVVEIPDLALQKVAINPVDEEDVVAAYNKTATEAGAKYLLIFHAAGGVEHSTNVLKWTYITIIGAAIFPGNEIEGQASLQAFLYKAGSTKPCFIIETEGYADQIRPAFFINNRSVYAKARDKAFTPFMENLVK